MKLSSVIFLSLAVVSTVIGVHRTILEKDVVGNYWIFMVSFACLMVFRFVNQKPPADKTPVAQKKSEVSKKAKR